PLSNTSYSLTLPGLLVATSSFIMSTSSLKARRLWGLRSAAWGAFGPRASTELSRGPQAEGLRGTPSSQLFHSRKQGWPMFHTMKRERGYWGERPTPPDRSAERSRRSLLRRLL
ncbi:MAG: hypothetical protein ACETWR_12435, partial [Anaerolineae bacterium]